MADINGKAASIEYYLPRPVGALLPKALWTNKVNDTWHGNIEGKEEIQRRFMSLTTLSNVDDRALRALLDGLLDAAIGTHP